MTTTVKNNSEVVHSGTTISIDAMGGDLGPSAIVAGLVRAAKIDDSIPVSYTHLTLPTICSV